MSVIEFFLGRENCVRETAKCCTCVFELKVRVATFVAAGNVPAKYPRENNKAEVSRQLQIKLTT